jgi:AcrR family transcriptional regulator
MADIVDHSGTSIGSIYHHFGGKRELFLAIFERLAADIDRYIEAASETSGDPTGQLAFEMTARAYLNAIWAYRRAALVLASGDTPSGFDAVRRSNILRGFRLKPADVEPITDATIEWLDRLTS